MTFAENIEVDLGLKKINETISRVFIPAKLIDNPSLLENDPGYVARLMQLPEIERMRLMDGIWDAFEGQVFTELNQEIHGYDPKMTGPGFPPAEWERYRSFDWGYAAPGCVGWWAVDFDGRIWRYKEWYIGRKDEARGSWVGLKLSSSEIARGIREREKGEKVNPGPADPSIYNPRWNAKDHIVGPPIAEELASEGIHFLKADNDRILGKQQVHSRLRVGDDGEPMLKVSLGCENWWRTMPEMRENPRKIEDIETKDVEDHAYDETRYMCMFRPVRPRVQPQGPPLGSFQAERAKYLRAKQHAERYGVSMVRAYERVK